MSSLGFGERGNEDIPGCVEMQHPEESSATLDLESQPRDEDKKGWLRLSERQQHDTRHMVAPRFSHLSGACTLHRAKRLLRLWREIEQKTQAGDDVDELMETLCREIEGYYQHIVQSSQVLALDQPNKIFLQHLLPAIRAGLSDEDAAVFEEFIHDWVSISQPDKLGQIISLIPITKVGNWLFKPFLEGEERIGGSSMRIYHERSIRAVIFAVFNLVIGVFACAPVAIQSLNVHSAAGEVATYLVFMIVFGWMNQALVRGFEKLLLTCLAYAGVMATVMRQSQ